MGELKYSLVVSLVIVLLAMTHLTWKKGPVAKSIATVVLFVCSSMSVTAFGSHLCDQGNAPAYLAILAGVATAATPWLKPIQVWLQRTLAGAFTFFAMSTASELASSYHRDTITGNPEYSSGRFWHTPLTGQYPRGIAVGELHALEDARRAEFLEQLSTQSRNNTEQDKALNPTTDAPE